MSGAPWVTAPRSASGALPPGGARCERGATVPARRSPVMDRTFTFAGLAPCLSHTAYSVVVPTSVTFELALVTSNGSRSSSMALIRLLSVARSPPAVSKFQIAQLSGGAGGRAGTVAASLRPSIHTSLGRSGRQNI